MARYDFPFNPIVRRDLLNRGLGMLAALDYCREKTNNPRLGQDGETEFLNNMLADLALVTTMDEAARLLENPNEAE